MEKFFGRLRELIYYHDTEPLEVAGGFFRLMSFWHLGFLPGVVSLALTGILSLYAAYMGDLRLRSVSNLIGVTVPAALLVTDMMGIQKSCSHSLVFAMLVSAWCLVRTMSESHVRGKK